MGSQHLDRAEASMRVLLTRAPTLCPCVVWQTTSCRTRFAQCGCLERVEEHAQYTLQTAHSSPCSVRRTRNTVHINQHTLPHDAHYTTHYTTHDNATTPHNIILHDTRIHIHINSNVDIYIRIHFHMSTSTVHQCTSSNIASQYITSHYSTLHGTALHRITLLDLTLHHDALLRLFHDIVSHYIALRRPRRRPRRWPTWDHYLDVCATIRMKMHKQISGSRRFRSRWKTRRRPSMSSQEQGGKTRRARFPSRCSRESAAGVRTRPTKRKVPEETSKKSQGQILRSKCCLI